MSCLLRIAAVTLAVGSIACSSTPVTPPLPPEPEDPKQIRQELRSAVAVLEQAEADGTLSPRECDEVAAAFVAMHDPRQPSTAAGPFNAGVVRERCGQPQQAMQRYRQAIATDPEHAGAHNNLGILHWRAGEHGAAFASFERAVAADPALPMARNNLSEALRARYVQAGVNDDFTRAEHALRNALAVDSDSAIAHENLARLYYDRGRSHDRSYLLLAGLVITRGLRVLHQQDRRSAELHNLRGLLLIEEGNPVLALRAFEEAIVADPEHAQAHLNIAMIALRFRDFDTAQTSLDVAQQDPRYRDDVDVLLATAVAHRGLRRYDDAKEVLLRAEQLDAEDPRPLYNLGILLQEHIGPERAQGPNAADASGSATFDAGPLVDARQFFDRFTTAAGTRFPSQAADARARIASIDQFLRDIEDLEQLQAEHDRLEALAREQQAQERERLLQLERRAKQAHGEGPQPEQRAK